MKRALPWLFTILVSGCADQSARWERGLALSPVSVEMGDREVTEVGLGSYLVNAVAACNDCHTSPSYAPGSDPFQGQRGQVNAANYLAGGACFGSILSPNITPDERGLPAGLTREEFIRLMRTGREHETGESGEEEEILQVMPWPVYARMTDEDLNAIYSYLLSIPHAEPLNISCPTPKQER